ncbi:MAG: phage portal protein [Ruminococcaceae bacterium]|nr:phage portal protein [Oscillospiraceae bacterium]
MPQSAVQSELIRTKLSNFGRLELLVEDKKYDNSNIVDALNKLLAQHKKNSQDIQTLWDTYTGKQAILNRVKVIRPEICNKIVENHAAEIVDFKTGFTFGEPVQYIYRGESQHDDNSNDDNGIGLLNRIMDMTDKSTKDRELAEWFYICGQAYRIILPDLTNEAKIQSYVCDPRYTFVAKTADYRRKPKLAVTYTCEEQGLNGFDSKQKYSVYSDDHYWLIVDGKIIEDCDIFTGIPIIEYRLCPSRQGAFEKVLPLLDALNNMESNRMDGVEQIIQNFIWFNNCEVDAEKLDQLKDKGAIQTRSSNGNQASIQILTTNLDQQQSQTYVDYLYQMVLTIAAVPDRKASAGGNTGQALVIGQGWTGAESAAKAMELEFKAAEKRFLRSALNILKNTAEYGEQLSSLTFSDVDVKFTRNQTDNLLTKTQGLINQLEAGVHPRIAIANCNLYSDPEQVYLDSQEYLVKWKLQEQSENVPDVLDGELEQIMSMLGASSNPDKNGGDVA